MDFYVSLQSGHARLFTYELHCLQNLAEAEDYPAKLEALEEHEKQAATTKFNAKGKKQAPVMLQPPLMTEMDNGKESGITLAIIINSKHVNHHTVDSLSFVSLSFREFMLCFKKNWV